MMRDYKAMSLNNQADLFKEQAENKNLRKRIRELEGELLPLHECRIQDQRLINKLQVVVEAARTGVWALVHIALKELDA